MTRQFLHFCVGGVLGLAADVAALELLTRGIGAGPYTARLLSFLLAVTATWTWNRRYTFTPRPGEPLLREWLRYFAANAVGSLINYGTYALLVHQVPLVRRWLLLGVAAGSIAGLLFNYLANKHLVYRPQPPRH